MARSINSTANIEPGIFKVYRNLNRKGVVWSIKSKKSGLVRQLANEVHMVDVQLLVSVKGRERVRKTGKKNVHAYVQGGLVESHGNPGGWLICRYDPYEFNTFVLYDGTPVYGAEKAIMYNHGLVILNPKLTP